MNNGNASDRPSRGICDTHMHVYGPGDRFPANGLEPGATFDDYMKLRARLGVARTVYVQPSGYGRDHACLLDALVRDAGNARGIAIVGTEATKSDLRKLNDAGVRGVRFHSLAEGCLPISDLEPVAKHIADTGWHVIVQTAGEELPGIEERLGNLPCDVVIDHFGRMPEGAGVNHPAFQSLLRLLDHPHCWLKLSAPYYIAPDFETAGSGPERVRKLRDVAPDRLIWGSNWPHPSLGPDDKPDDKALMVLVGSWCGDDWPKVAADNPARLYGF